MLKLKLLYSDDLMGRADSLKKTLMLWNTEGRKRRGWQRMRWLGGITERLKWTELCHIGPPGCLAQNPITKIHSWAQTFHNVFWNSFDTPLPPAYFFTRPNSLLDLYFLTNHYYIKTEKAIIRLSFNELRVINTQNTLYKAPSIQSEWQYISKKLQKLFKELKIKNIGLAKKFSNILQKNSNELSCCWSWSSNTLATLCEELTLWKRPRCWEELKARGEGSERR